MIRALRLRALGQQPFATASITNSTTTTANSSLQRLATRARANTSSSVSQAPRSVHVATNGSRIAAASAGRVSSGSRAWRGPTATQKNVFARTQRRNFNWSWSRKSQSGGAKSAEESLSLSGRLRKLSREYGWAAVGVYLGLSVLDFPFCFLLVKWAGTERIAAIEEWVMSRVKKAIPESFKERWHEWRAEVKDVEKEELGDNHFSEDVEKLGWGVQEAQERHRADASLATQLALAYAIHKSFIFIRVPLTAAVTPKVVKVLRSWGWQIGKRKPRKSKNKDQTKR